MTIINRTCANCAAFNTAPDGDDPRCWNLVFYIEFHDTPQARTRQPELHDSCSDHLTHSEDLAQTALIDANWEAMRAQKNRAAHQAQIEQHRQEASPEFMTAMSACLRLREALGIDHPDVATAMVKAMMIAPQSMNDFMETLANELGLIPDAYGYTEDREPVFSLESIATNLDMTMIEAKAAMLTQREAVDLPVVLIDSETVHRKH